MKTTLVVLSAISVVLLFACDHAENPVDVNSLGEQAGSLLKVGSGLTNQGIEVQGQFALTNIVTWGDQSANPGGRFFVKGLVADFATGGNLPGGGQLWQFATYDAETFTGPTHGSAEWTFDWNGEQITVSGRWEGKSSLDDGGNILKISMVCHGSCSSGPVVLKASVVGPSLGPFSYEGVLKTP